MNATSLPVGETTSPCAPLFTAMMRSSFVLLSGDTAMLIFLRLTARRHRVDLAVEPEGERAVVGDAEEAHWYRLERRELLDFPPAGLILWTLKLPLSSLR